MSEDNRWDTVNIYRMTHIDNLEHILRFGIVAESSPNANPSFKCIGNRNLIQKRKYELAPDPPGGCLNEYIPFYFGKRSPMLYIIATGWGEVERINQEDIIYLTSSVGEIRKHNLPFFFTDGHIMSLTSKRFTRISEFDQLDWQTINSKTWQNDEKDWRRKDKKQAEFLVRKTVPVKCIIQIVTYNDLAYHKVKRLLEMKKQETDIIVSQKDEEYYYDFIR